MHALPEDNTSELLWVKPRWSKRQFELRAGEGVLATLAWTRGSHALAEWAEGDAYHLSREGWFRRRIVVRGATAAATDEPRATFAPHGNGGTLTFPDGRAFVWKKPRRLTTERVWADSAATELVRFRPARHATAVMTSQPSADPLPELPLLILLGQYLLVLASQDAEAASTAATVAVIASS